MDLPFRLFFSILEIFTVHYNLLNNIVTIVDIREYIIVGGGR